jgi:formate hydrogenlyase subunit 3/multisubunit Na+/H+ antiporter MnhD subunit
MNAWALPFAIGWPLLLAAGLLLRPFRVPSRLLAPWAALPALAASLVQPAEFASSWLMLGARLGLDAVAAVLLPATAGLWLAAGLVAQGYLAPGRRRDFFFVWFLAAMAGNLLLLVALDVVVFYLGFALMSFASYGLVVHEGDARAKHAGRYYIAMVVIGEVAVISALMLLASLGPIEFASVSRALAATPGGRDELVLALLLVGFGIKAGVFGLHFWLPLAHPVAPAPASAVLSGAMIKAGLVAWLRILPLGEAARPTWGAALAALGLVTAFCGVLAGLPQREAKTVLAYSSVSQMGLMAFGVGLGLALPELWPVLFPAVLLFAVHHGLSKGVLFLGAGLAAHPLRPVHATVAGLLLLLAALALAGGPLTGGLVAKLALKHGAAHAPARWGEALPTLLALSSGMTALLMLRFLALAWPRASADGTRLSPGLLAPWLLLACASAAAPWWLAGVELRGEALGAAASLGALPPLAGAVALAAAAAWLRRRRRIPGLPALPAGDLGIPLERGLIRLGHGAARVCREAVPRVRETALGAVGSLASSGPAWAGRLGLAEARLGAWACTGLLLLLLAVAFAWMSA